MEFLAAVLLWSIIILIFALISFNLHKTIKVYKRRSKFKLIKGDKKETGPYGKSR